MTNPVPCIAIVDDEAAVRIMLGRLLRLADYETELFSSGEDFIASLAARHPDCLLLDIHMPGLTGFDVQSLMNAAKVDIPTVFVTASDDLALEQKALSGGATELLRKPFSSDELLKAIAWALLQKPRRDP